MNSHTIWDVAVIGGGQSGMMAAGRAAELGARVILIEKNETLGKKLLITGGGRCNLTNAEPSTRAFLSKLKGNDKFLFSPFAQMDIEKTISFFNDRGLSTKIEAGRRVFPTSDKSRSVLDVLVKYMKQGRVEILTKSSVNTLIKNVDNTFKIEIKDSKQIIARNVVIATGGTSRPETGSTGDGFMWLASLGHTVKEPNASLVPIAIHDTWVKTLQGITLTDIKINVLQNGKKQFGRLGNILFTHFGISGPTIINMSKDVRDLLQYGTVTIELDLFPNLDDGAINEKLKTLFIKEQNKKLINVICVLAPVAAFRSILINLSKMNPDTFCHSITREDRLALAKLLKGVPMSVKEILGKEKAIVTSGGIPLTEVDTKTMQSKLHNNLYLTGDILDIDRPSGGYSLQLCWTTGYVAGTAARNALKKN
ncbi:MAG: NAD(P)/FAD-dependent oxidoreductase [Candidatus Paceibacterota bacterium]|jgi:hypothetical protein